MPLASRPFHTVALAATISLCACGGGGGGGGGGSPDLAVAFNYGVPDPTYVLWSPMEQSPTLQGLDGHTPNCTLAGGSLPAGVTLDRSSCALRGTPDALGEYDYTVRLTVDGFSGSVTASGHMEIRKPALAYAESGPLEWKKPWNATAGLSGFTLQAGDTVGNFHVIDSSLPADLTIDPQTGTISGTFIGFAASPFSISATITHQGRTVDIESGQIEPVSLAPTVVYPAQESPLPQVGVPFEGPAAVFDDGSPIASPYQGAFTIELGSNAPCQDPQPLPQGLVLNAQTGAITGTPTAAFEGCVAVRYRVTVPNGGGVMGWRQVGMTVLP